MPARIVLADDDLDLNSSISALLSGAGYDIVSFDDPRAALEEIRENDCDLLIADLKMPHLTGLEMAEVVRELRPDTRILVITGHSSMQSVLDALRMGVDQYIPKPFNAELLLFQVRRALERRNLEMENRRYAKGIARLVEERTHELVRRQLELRTSQLENIFAIGNIIEARDTYTRGHTERVTLYAVSVAEKLGWENERIRNLGIGSPLHDIGKIGVADAILKKQGPLDFSEYERMKDHPAIGYEMVRGIDLAPGTVACILYHHERFDGKGYPFGIKGADIPAEGRIMAICDAFDAMTSTRIYRPAMTVEKALDIVCSNSGSQFDPDYADVFKELVESHAIDSLLYEADISEEFGDLLERLMES